MNFKAWIRQPTTVNGLAALIGLVSSLVAGILTHLLSHDPETVSYMAGAAGLFAGGVVNLVLPDNSAAQSTAEKIVSDAVAAAASRHLVQVLPSLVADGMAVVAAIGAKPPAATPPLPSGTVRE